MTDHVYKDDGQDRPNRWAVIVGVNNITRDSKVTICKCAYSRIFHLIAEDSDPLLCLLDLRRVEVAYADMPDLKGRRLTSNLFARMCLLFTCQLSRPRTGTWSQRCVIKRRVAHLFRGQIHGDLAHDKRIGLKREVEVIGILSGKFRKRA